MQFERDQAVLHIKEMCKGRAQVEVTQLDGGVCIVELSSPIYIHLWEVLWDLWVDNQVTYPPIHDSHTIVRMGSPFFTVVGNQIMQRCYYCSRIIFPATQLDIPNFDAYDPYADSDDGGML